MHHQIVEGKRVEVLQFPELGELLIAGRKDLERAIQRHYLATDELRARYGSDLIPLPADKDAYWLRLPDRRVSVFREPFENLPEERLALLLERLGIDPATRHVSPANDWHLPL